MSYQHIENLYRPQAQEILQEKEVYCLEKIHGSSSHISFNDNELRFFAGGESHERFVAIFNQDSLLNHLLTTFKDQHLTIYGEVYGGKCQGMSGTYGKDLKFIAFEVKIGDKWLDVPDAEQVVKDLELRFVFYRKVETTLQALDYERDAPSYEAVVAGITEPKMREGIVIRPLHEKLFFNGERMVAKHKRPEFRETKTVREVDPDKKIVLDAANKIADEFVTEARLFEHVLPKIGNPSDVSAIPDVIKAMLEDVMREGSGEFEDAKEVRKAIGAATARMFKSRVCKIGT